MGRKTQITKELILQTALQMLIQDGYASITVKTLAKKIGCSTQPVVWHFENMQNFRKGFLDYCIAYTKELFTARHGTLDDMLIHTAQGYVTVAYNMPNLFRFVYMDNLDESKASDMVKALQLDNTQKLIDLLCQEKGLTDEQATSFLMNFEFYIHGIASYTASGFCKYSREQILVMANRAMHAFLESSKR